MHNRLAAVSLLAAAIPWLACGDGTSPPVPASISKVAGDAQTGIAGEALPSPVVVAVRDGAGAAIAGATVQFAVTSGGGSVSPSSGATAADGRASASWTLGTDASATHTLRAAVGSLSADFSATAVPGAAAALVRVSGDAQSAEAGAPLRDSLVVKVTDRFGNAVERTTVQWTVTSGGGSLAPEASTTGTAGLASTRWTLGAGTGTQTATAAAPGLTGSPVSFTATATPSTAPAVTGIAPALLTPGITATITGTNFSATPAQNDVRIAGVAATVTAASSTSLTVAVPATGFTCEPTREVTVAITVGGRTGSRQHPLRVATLHTLAAGESVTILDGTLVRCNELAATGGRYFISVFNTIAPSASSAFQLRGAAGISAAATAVAAGASAGTGAQHAPARPTATAGGIPSRSASSPLAPATTAHGRSAPAAPQAATLELLELRRRHAAHLRMLDANLRTLERLRPQPVTARAARAAGAPQTEPPPQVGDRLTLRIPSWGSSNLCTNFTQVTARVVYSGSRAVILEDTDTVAPLQGTMDSLFVRVGQEYDAGMHALIEQNFGNPLALDAQLDNNGRIFMLFSKVVNDFGSIAAFVFSGDFSDPSQCAASNKREIFYGQVPTNPASGFDQQGSRENWMRTVRSTLVHEVKHLASFAERIARNASSFEELWLEEATAMTAEELWARTIFGYGQKGNVNYRQSIYCEVRPSLSECAGKPFVMANHFVLLYDYYAAIDTLTPLHQVNKDDFSFYGSGWSFLRWAIDHHAASESAFLQALTRETSLRGLASLTASTGRSHEEMLADWSLATAVDDVAGFTPARAQLQLPSWNTRDVFAGLNRDFPTIFAAAFPLAVRPVTFGLFTVDVSQLRGGTASIFELSGSQSGTQLVEVRSAGGGDPPERLRIALVKVQ